MTIAAARHVTAHRVVWFGQSRLLYPASPNTVPQVAMAGRGVPSSNKAIDGFSWTALRVRRTERLVPEVAKAVETHLVMVGGESDVIGGDTGAQAYADALEHAQWAKGAAGFASVTATTMLGASSAWFDAGMDAERQDYNARLIANAEGAFDHVVDVDVAPLVYADGSIYYDGGGIHLNATGSPVFAGLLDSTLDGLLA